MIIVRYSEIGLKSKPVRREMERALIAHLRRALGGVKVTREWGRIFVHSDSREDAERAARVFGVASTSLAEVASAEYEELIKAGLEYATQRVESGTTFALRVRRHGKHSYRSIDVARELGARVVEATGAKVDLKAPQKEIFIEIRNDRAYLYDEIIPGVGGLPYATQGKVLALVSGGIDSPVAAWLMMRRGAEVVALFMDPTPLVDERTPRRAEAAIRALSGWAGEPIKSYIVPYGDVLIQLLKVEDYRMGCVLCKRMMFRVAGKIARREGALALVTGESLGQVASQTLANLATITEVVSMPVLRPLIGMDKEEIIQLAKRIGTYEISIQPANCCLGPPPKPVTKASVERAKRAEAGLDVEKLAEEMVAKAKVVELG
ncbi:MAG: tRNA 4-thiouridine(8) synthase ThiI [Euryarchaeota archaeon]|nr:tRNA 4-thiouridine(8) synthase ThiI [Euryarchaeota archaeon]